MTRYNLLSNKNIRLRAVEPADADKMWEIDNDSSHWISNCMSAPFSRENMLVYASTYDADPIRSGEIRLIIEFAENQKKDNNQDLIGILDIYDISSLHSRAFIGIYILPEFRRKGYAFEALETIEKYLYSILNIEIEGAKVSSDNKASMHLFEKLGYKLSGTLENWIKSGNSRYNMHIYCKNLSKNSSSDFISL